MTIVVPVLVLAGAAVAGLLLAIAVRPSLRAEAPVALMGVLLVFAAAVAPDVWVLALVVLMAVVLQARLRPSGQSARAPALAGGLLALAGLAAVSSQPGASRLAGLCAALAVAALAGVLPYMGDGADVSPRPATSGASWSVFLAPALAFAVFARSLALLSPDGVRTLGAVLLGFGFVNVAWGLVTALNRSQKDAWRAMLLVEWGFAMCGLGFISRDGTAAAVLLLGGLLLLRLPVLLWDREEGCPPLVALAMGGSPPFAGFPGRLLLLRAAMAVSWVLALLLAAAMVAALPASLRLAGPVGDQRRLRVGRWVALGLSAAAGVFPLDLLRPAGLG